MLQTIIFAMAFVFAPKHGMLANKRRARKKLRVYDEEHAHNALPGHKQ
jgi:manganese/iron transport system permease protein